MVFEEYQEGVFVMNRADRKLRKERNKGKTGIIVSVLAVSLIFLINLSGCARKDLPKFSEETMFTLRTSEPWFYESLQYTLKTDGTLIVLYRGLELGREQLSGDRMSEISKLFTPEKVYTMNVGREDNRTDGTSRYIILYDSDGNEIEIGGYELRGGDRFNSYFEKLYALCEDDYTKQFSDLLDECARECTTYQEKYLSGTGG